MLEKIIAFFKKIFGKEDILKIEAPKENENNLKPKNLFEENLKNTANNRIRLLDIQKDLKSGNIKEEDLESNDIKLLKQLYCEQILELANSIEYYTKRIKA